MAVKQRVWAKGKKEDSRRVTRSEEEFPGGVLEGRWARQPAAVALSVLFLSCFTKCGN